MYYILDENKNVIICNKQECFDQREYMFNTHTKHIADDIVNGKRVSTIWLGIDHSWECVAKPLVFETMIFDKNSEELYYEIYLDRYSTWKEAEDGHQRAIEWVKNGCKERQ